MTSGCNPLYGGLDSMFVVYALVEGHPAGPATERMLRGHAGWFVLGLSLLEAYHAITKVYGVDAQVAYDLICQFATGPVAVIETPTQETLRALEVARLQGIDVTDAHILRACRTLGTRVLATDDGRLSRVATAQGLVVENPIDAHCRACVAVWEEAHLPPKGLARVLWSVGRWLQGQSDELAETFRSATGGYAHLP